MTIESVVSLSDGEETGAFVFSTPPKMETSSPEKRRYKPDADQTSDEDESSSITDLDSSEHHHYTTKDQEEASFLQKIESKLADMSTKIDTISSTQSHVRSRTATSIGKSSPPVDDSRSITGNERRASITTSTSLLDLDDNMDDFSVEGDEEASKLHIRLSCLRNEASMNFKFLRRRISELESEVDEQRRRHQKFKDEIINIRDAVREHIAVRRERAATYENRLRGMEAKMERLHGLFSLYYTKSDVDARLGHAASQVHAQHPPSHPPVDWRYVQNPKGRSNSYYAPVPPHQSAGQIPVSAAPTAAPTSVPMTSGAAPMGSAPISILSPPQGMNTSIPASASASYTGRVGITTAAQGSYY